MGELSNATAGERGAQDRGRCSQPTYRRADLSRLVTSAANEAGSWPCGSPTRAPGASVQAFFGNGFFGRIVNEIPAPGVWDFSTFNFDSDVAAADAKAERTLIAMNADLRGFSTTTAAAGSSCGHVGRPGDLSAQLRQLLPAGDPPRMTMRATFSACSWHPECSIAAAGLDRIHSVSRLRKRSRSAIRRSTTSSAHWSAGWRRRGARAHRGGEVCQRSAGAGNTAHAPLCAYPKTAVYKGTGSTDDAANFECRRPKHERDKGDEEDDD